MRYAGFVRAVMLGRDGLHRPVLLDCLRSAGADRPRSYLTTGNVTFTADERSVESVRASVEEQIEAVVGRRTELYVRSIAHLTTLAESDPFSQNAVPDAVEHEVSFTYEPIEPTSLDLPIESTGGYVTIFDATPGEVFAAQREIAGRRKGAGGFVERTLGQRVTTRGWRTVLRVVDDPE